MMLGFKRRFAPMVWAGTKRHTIRLDSVLERRVGETCYCYVDSRQATMAKLGQWTCSQIQKISIYADGTITVDRQELDRDEKDLLCWRDGFRPETATERMPRGSFRTFMDYWCAEAKGKRAFPFNGKIIHWAFEASSRAPLPPQLMVRCIMCQWSGIAASNLTRPRDWVKCPQCGISSDLFDVSLREPCPTK